MVLIILESIRELSNLKVTEYNIDAPENLQGKKLIFLSDYHEAAKLNDKIINEIKAENEKLVEEIKKLKNKEEKSKIAFIDSQKTWSNLALNIISYSFKF